jgi:hypothetical protein
VKDKTTYPLRLPRSLKNAVERLSKEDGTSMNQFVATAVAEKVSALETARLFADRKSASRLPSLRQNHEAPRRKTSQ